MNVVRRIESMATDAMDQPTEEVVIATSGELPVGAVFDVTPTDAAE